MTNNDELALKMRKVIYHGAPGVWLSPIGVDALLAERDADKKLIAELDQRVIDYAGIATARAQHVFNLEKRIAELEARLKQVSDARDEMESDVDAANARVDTKCAQLCTQDEEIEMLRQQVSDLEESKANLATLYDMNLCDMLPGPQYMDLPDGGQVEPLEQVARMVEEYRQRIAELESRTVSVKLPKRKSSEDYVDENFNNSDLAAVYNACRWQCQVKIMDACYEAGIKLEVGE